MLYTKTVRLDQAIIDKIQAILNGRYSTSHLESGCIYSHVVSFSNNVKVEISVWKYRNHHYVLSSLFDVKDELVSQLVRYDVESSVFEGQHVFQHDEDEYVVNIVPIMPVYKYTPMEVPPIEERYFY